MSGYDSEYGKDAWKRWRRIVEAIDPTMQAMLHEFGAEMYEQGRDEALQAAREAVAALPRLTGVEAALAAIDALREGK